MSIITVPSAILDMIWYLWILLSLVRTIQQLSLRKQVIKLQLYRKFLGILLSAAGISVVVMIIETWINYSHTIVPWQLEWMLECFWEFFYFLLVASMAILWRPSPSNQNLSNPEYEASIRDNDDNIQIPLENITITTGEMTQRKKTRRFNHCSCYNNTTIQCRKTTR